MLYRILPLVLCLLLSTIAKSQFADKTYYLIDSLELKKLNEEDSNKLDSLLKVFHKDPADSVKLKILNKLSELQDFNVSSRYNLVLLSEVKRQLSRPKQSESYVKFLNRYYGNALYNLNYYYSMINEEDSSFRYLQLCLEPFRKGGARRGLADAYNAIGVYYNRQGIMDSCLKYFQKGLTLQEEIKNKDGIARAHLSIGFVYRDLDQFDKALQECQLALKMEEELGNVDDMSEILNGLGMIYKWSGDTVKAEQAYSKSLELAQQIRDPYRISTAKLNLGIIYQNRGQYDKAIKNYQESLAGFKEIRNPNGMAYTLNSLAIVHLEMGQPQKALQYAEESHRLCLTMGYPESLINSSQVLYETYSKLGRYKEAFEYIQYHFHLKDSVMNIETQKKTLKDQLEFENKRKMLELEKVQEQKDLKTSEEKKQQQIIIVSVAVCLLLVAVFTVFLFNRFRIISKQKKIIEYKEQETQKQNRVISEQKHLVEEKNKEILDSITYAKRLQEAILPSFMDVKAHLPESFIYYKPKDIVAGDFYWMEHLPSAAGAITLIAAADSTGHGVPGAMVSVVCSNALNRTVKEFNITEPGEILDKTREIVLETFAKSNKDVKDGMDISLASIQYTSSGIRIKWAGANNPLWYVQNNTLQEIRADKQPVGKAEHAKPFTTHTLDLQKDDMLYLFTDGFADQFGGPQGKKFKYKPFGELLLKLHREDPLRQSTDLNAVFENWRGELEQVDDVCVIGIRL